MLEKGAKRRGNVTKKGLKKGRIDKLSFDTYDSTMRTERAKLLIANRSYYDEQLESLKQERFGERLEKGARK